jgi:hypothetical protein
MSEDDWTEWDAGPVSRPYALTGGYPAAGGTSL